MNPLHEAAGGITPKLPGGFDAERYPKEGGVERGIITSVNDNGTLSVLLRSGGQATAIPVTPSKTIGTGFQRRDNILLFKEYDGTIYAMGFIAPLSDSDRSVNHPLQRSARGNDVLISPEQDTGKSGFSALAGGVTTSSSGPAAQTITTPSGGREIKIYENKEEHTNAGRFLSEIDSKKETVVELSGKTLPTSARASVMRMDKNGISITFDTLKKAAGAKEDVDGPKSEVSLDANGNITVKAIGSSLNIESAQTIKISTQALVEILANFITLAGGGPAVARIGDRVNAGNHIGIIVTGSGKVFSG